MIKGRKRHLLVDTLGLMHGLLVHSAGVQDRAGGSPAAGAVLWADATSAADLGRRRLPRSAGPLGPPRRQVGAGDRVAPARQHGLRLLKWRWIVERTIGWLNLARRLSKDYEVLPAGSEAFIRPTMISIMLARLAHEA